VNNISTLAFGSLSKIGRVIVSSYCKFLASSFIMIISPFSPLDVVWFVDP